MLVPHGLGIPSHDHAELKSLQRALGDDLKRIALAPIKAQIGNLAAGCGVDAAAAVLSLHSGMIPPTPNTRKPAGGTSLNVSPTAREQRVDVAVSSVYSLGGQNAALVFRRCG